MLRELSKFDQRKDLSNDNIIDYFNDVRKNVELMIVDLHKEDLFDDRLLKHVVGIKCKNDKYSRIPGNIAKNFVCNQPAYAYPLLKTHKLKSDLLDNVDVLNIPVRLLQSAGSITTSRVTAYLETILNPISIKYCNYKLKEYCRDSKSYLELITAWKNNYTNQNTLYLVAADVQALYPSIPRRAVKKSIIHALETCSNYTPAIIDQIVRLIMYCLEHVVVQHKSQYYS